MFRKVFAAALALAFSLFQITPAFAAITATPVFVQVPRLMTLQIANATGTTLTAVGTTGTNGDKITGIWATNTDTGAAYNVTISMYDGATQYTQAVVSVAASSGTVSGTPAVNLLTTAIIPGLPLDSDGNPYLIIPAGDTLYAKTGTQVSSGKFVNIMAQGADF